MNQQLEMSERDQARFWSKVALPDGQGCMLWLKATTPKGYGQFSLNRQNVYAHRLSYVIAYGPIPDGMVVDHVKDRGCTSRACVAPEHLEAVTQAENVRRGDTNAWRLAKTHCPQGHPYDGSNLIRDTASGARRCRTCRNKQGAEKYRRRRAA